ncbi:hypothetical protein IWQ60_009967 [Tieghemiomyces parasiticus]|uniref:General transcription and DNA repair factor IIH subunit TFB5 n=1 Tax=Tieghemiomyces parasiticus TaxID=78921 RepID=A0A9W7ZVW4_9FUNG|nr:hypothetical protein IWQ60_009967 [Tieghemiomyces parasiticus]
MVQASKGVLIECDIIAKQVILNLNQTHNFIVADLDDTHLFIKADYARMLQSELDRIINENTYTVGEVKP